MVLVSPPVKSEFDKITITRFAIVFASRYLITGNPKDGVMAAYLCSYSRALSRMDKVDRAKEEAKFSGIQC